MSPLDSDLTIDGKGTKGVVVIIPCSTGGCITVFGRIVPDSDIFTACKFKFQQTWQNMTKEKGSAKFVYIFDIGFSLNLGLDIANSELEPNTFEFQINKFGSRARVRLLESMSQEAWAGAPEPPLLLRDSGQFTGAGEGMPFSSVGQPPLC